jgi:hypothetical protein
MSEVEKLIELHQRIDAIERRLGELDRLFERHVELTKAIETGVSPSEATNLSRFSTSRVH